VLLCAGVNFYFYFVFFTLDLMALKEEMVI